MANFARLDDSGVVIETAASDPAELFFEELAAQFISVPETVKPGWKKDGKNWAEPEPVALPEPPAAPKPPLAKASFLDALTRAERLALRGARSSDPIVDDFLLMMDETGIADITSSDGEQALAHFVSEGYLTAERVEAIKGL